MKIHELKILSPYFEHVLDGTKNFEIRKNDRKFNIGDIVKLKHWDNQKEEFTGQFVYRRISFITDFNQRKGYVVFAMLPCIDFQAASDEINPCKICGGKGIVELGAGDFLNQAEVCCDSCDAVTGAYDSVHDAIDAWNSGLVDPMGDDMPYV